MTLSTVLEVGIGLALIYYLLGLIVSAITETVKNIFDMRAQAFEGVLKKLLETKGDVLFSHFRGSTFVKALEPVAPKFLQVLNRINRKVSDVPNTTFSLAIVEALASEELVFDGVRAAITQLIETMGLDENVKAILTNIVTDLEGKELVAGIEGAIEQIPDENVKQKLGELVGLLTLSPDDQVKRVVAGIEGLPPGDIKDALRGLLDLSMTDVNAFRNKIEAWYDDMVTNFRSLFKRNMQAVVLWVSLAVTLIVGPDTIQVAEFLWEQPTHRESVAAAAPVLVEKYGESVISEEEIDKLSAEKKIELFEKRAESVRIIVSDLEALDIPLPWWRAPFPDDTAEWKFGEWSLAVLSKLLGLAVTWGATSLGAPFWYDILKKINPQSSSKDKEKGEG